METIETMQKLKVFAAGFGTMNVRGDRRSCLPGDPHHRNAEDHGEDPGIPAGSSRRHRDGEILPLQVNTIGDLYSVSNALPAFHMPAFSYDVIQGPLSDAFTIAILQPSSPFSPRCRGRHDRRKTPPNTEPKIRGAGRLFLLYLAESRQQAPSPVQRQTSRTADALR